MAAECSKCGARGQKWLPTLRQWICARCGWVRDAPESAGESLPNTEVAS